MECSLFGLGGLWWYKNNRLSGSGNDLTKSDISPKLLYCSAIYKLFLDCTLIELPYTFFISDLSRIVRTHLI